MHAVSPDRPAGPEPRSRWKWLLVLSLAALLLHAAGLSGLEWVWPQHEAARLPAEAMRVRVVDDAAQPFAPLVEVPPPEPERAPPVKPTARPAPVRAAAAKVAATPRKITAASAAPVEVPAPPTPPQRLAAAAPAAAASPVTAPVAADEATPHYRTRMPPAITLRYEMQRGILRGTGDLSWRPQGDHYELKLEAKVGALPVLTQVSAGGFDTRGVAPERFTDQRLRRGTSAANFQRGAGKITFSGAAAEYALHEGAQDRLSWMVQLTAIVAAEPQLAVPGAKVVMFVVGSHGDASVWSFRCIGPEDVQTGVGTIAATRFVREPREPYDTTVQVWLDPQRHELPVRATQKSGPNDEGFDLRLQEVISSN